MTSLAADSRLAGAATWRRVAVRAAVLAGLWGLLTAGRPDSWLVGAPAVAAATAVSAALLPPDRLRLRWRGVPAFAAFFLWHSLRGGIDVAGRALARRPRLRPAIVRFRSILPARRQRLLLGAVMSLLPGTLLVTMDGECIEVHVLDRTADPERELRALEARVAAVLGADAPAGETL
ncbi:MAG TPA: Na+/H+ antiporter subunit E [Thermoanaerobaculaceae bacterium]|nr:Na+/H+ antiporter subunit E [Thermoanaerobaculaceae bacterium]HRS16626.1 Na+/H+ antiporter subunit E [Thermoanaerobaculaceae bacterium]